MPTQRIAYLLQQYLDKRITQEELAELSSLLEDESAAGSMQQEMEKLVWAEMEKRPRARVWSLQRAGWAAAAAVILAVGGWWLLRPGTSPKSPIVAVAHDAAPGGNRALLTLGDGKTVRLDEAQAGVVGRQGNTQLVKSKDAQLSYEASGGEETVEYNTLETPRGGQYRLVLPDGTKVWLNAATVLRYPTAFTGKDRVVQLNGEAYFEVAADAAKPFRVSVRGGEQVEVLGTHFNIMSYADEAAVDGAVAWKNGMFKFEEAELQQVMRQLARWYDLEVVYPHGVPTDRFQGEMYRDVNLSKLLKILEASGVHFSIEGKKLLVQ